MWLAFIGFTVQYFINMEVERYTCDRRDRRHGLAACG